MKTRITEMFGIEHPIIQGGMHFVGFAQLAYWLRAPSDRMHWWFAHMTGMIGFVHAYYVLGLRHADGWIGYGAKIHSARFRALAPPMCDPRKPAATISASNPQLGEHSPVDTGVSSPLIGWPHASV